MECDILVRGGEVVDPSQGLRGVRDVAIADGRIVAVGERLDSFEPRHVVDARGLLVVPGLIDLHVHVYPHSPFGLEPDPLCPAGGVTTMLDTGSAGSFNFAGFRGDVIDRARTRVLALVNLSCIGLAGFNLGELRDRRYADPQGVVETIRRNRDVAVGVKIRCSRTIVGEGQPGWDSLRDAIRAARESGTWLMVHVGNSPMSVGEIAAELAPGDCITHCYRSGDTRVVDEAGRVPDEVRAAAERGVVFDVGHGAGSFEWVTAEAALEQGFEPTTISTDVHTQNVFGPVYDLPTTMSKFLRLGLPLERVVEMTTLRPARVLGLEQELGTLRAGAIADVAVLERREGRFVLEDSYGETREGSELLVAAVTIRGGEIVPGGGSLLGRRPAE